MRSATLVVTASRSIYLVLRLRVSTVDLVSSMVLTVTAVSVLKVCYVADVIQGPNSLILS